MSCAAGAISATMSFPSTLVAGRLERSSSEREFFQFQLPLSQLSSRRTPVVYITGIPLARALSISAFRYGMATQASSPQELRQRLIDSRMGTGHSSQKA